MALVLCVVGFGFNLYQVITQGVSESYNVFYTVLRYGLLFFVTIALSVILISLLAKSYYSIDDKFLKTHYGFIVSKYEIAKIDKIILDRATEKLTVILSETSYLNIVIQKESYDEFITCLQKANPKIEYQIISEEKPKKWYCLTENMLLVYHKLWGIARHIEKFIKKLKVNARE